MPDSHWEVHVDTAWKIRIFKEFDGKGRVWLWGLFERKPFASNILLFRYDIEDLFRKYREHKHKHEYFSFGETGLFICADIQEAWNKAENHIAFVEQGTVVKHFKCVEPVDNS